MLSKYTADGDYRDFINVIKTKIKNANFRAALAVNAEGIKLYMELGKDIVEKQQKTNWGSNFIEQMSKDLRLEFPDQGGYSRSNLFYIRKFYLRYSAEFEKVQRLVGQIPWGYHTTILDKIESVDEAIFYMEKTLENNWGRSVLSNQIKSDLYNREGKALTNFKLTLPETDSELAQQMTRDPIVFDLTGSLRGKRERDLQHALMSNLTKFLLELGKGFAFMGEYYKLSVGEKEVEADLVFYHTVLKRYIVIELKVVDFDASFLGKLALYVSTVNHTVKAPDDKETIGLLICSGKNNLEVQYTLDSMSVPLGVAEYKFTQEIENKLPSKDEIETVVEQTVESFKLATETEDK